MASSEMVRRRWKLFADDVLRSRDRVDAVLHLQSDKGRSDTDRQGRRHRVVSSVFREHAGIGRYASRVYGHCDHRVFFGLCGRAGQRRRIHHQVHDGVSLSAVACFGGALDDAGRRQGRLGILFAAELAAVAGSRNRQCRLCGDGAGVFHLKHRDWFACHFRQSSRPFAHAFERCIAHNAVFQSMSNGRFWGSLFFLFLSFASLSTVLAVFENILSFAMDLFGWSRRKSVLVNLVLLLILTLPCILGFSVWKGFQPFGEGSNVLDLEDFLVSNTFLPLGSFFYLTFCTSRYGWGFRNFLAEVNAGTGRKVPAFIRQYMTFVLPVVLLIILIGGWRARFFG